MITHHTTLLSRLRALSLAMAALVASTASATPITTDSRIKTLVYNPNEVFAITTHYGYQSNIEFGPKETIDTISVGDRVGWQISPAGRRLFIRAQEENAHTNMTIVTNLRAYQFDLRSSTADAVFGSEELTYVVRFYYPEEGANNLFPAPNTANYMPASPPAANIALPSATVPTQTGNIPTIGGANTAIATNPQPTFNYRYTYSGAPSIAPLKIYDDGVNTYFKFPDNVMPQISVTTARGEKLAIATSRTTDGLISVNTVAPRFSLTQGGQQVIVYNEASGAL